MKSSFIAAQVLCALSICWAQSDKSPARLESEYYVSAYAQHYQVPIAPGPRHHSARVELANTLEPM